MLDVKIVKTDSEHTKDFVGLIGKIETLEKHGMVIEKGEGTDKRYLQTSRIEKITIKTRNTTYEMEVL